MKRSKVLSTPTRLSDMSFDDDIYDDDSQAQLKSDRINARKLHAFRRQLRMT